MEITQLKAQLVEASSLIDFIEASGPIYDAILGFIAAWWWLPLPFVLWPLFLHYYLLWRQHLWDIYKRPKSVLLEVRPPSDIVKPIRAMELVLNGFWQIYGPPNWYEKWIEGEQELSFSLEIIGIDGAPHFLVRLPAPYRNLFESHIYAQYGESEIYEVEDYVKKLPANMPNERWDFLGCAYKMTAPDCYPIKTYREFETEQEEDDEKVDPIAGLMEGIAKLNEGEQVWIQIKAKPTIDTGFEKMAEKEKNKLLQRASKSDEDIKIKSIPQMASELLFTNQITTSTKKEEKNSLSPDLMLSPGEKRKVDGLERKIAKKYFKCHIHQAYVARRDVMYKPTFRLPMSYFNNFGDSNSNSVIPYGATITKPSQNWYDWFWMKERRRYLSKRKFIRNYVRRTALYYPNVLPKATFFLNTEELATIFHFPSKVSAPPSILQRVESKRVEAPWGLPMEE